MELNKIKIDILEEIEKGNFDSFTKIIMQISMAQFVYLLENLEKDFKDKQNKEALIGKELDKV